MGSLTVKISWPHLNSKKACAAVGFSPPHYPRRNPHGLAELLKFREGELAADQLIFEDLDINIGNISIIRAVQFHDPDAGRGGVLHGPNLGLVQPMTGSGLHA